MKNPQLKMLSQIKESITRTVYNIDYNGTNYYLSDLTGENDFVIDTYVKNVYGNLIEDPEIVQTLIDFIDNFPKNSEFSN